MRFSSTVLIILLGLSIPASHAGAQIEFVVHAPQHIDRSKSIFLSGDHDALGNWSARGVEMHYDRELRAWRAEVDVSGGAGVAYKYTLGSWQNPETTASGDAVPNRIADCSAPCRIVDEIANLRLEPFHRVPQSASDNVRYFHGFYSRQFDNRRSVAVYLPPGYDNSARSYPVLYALDGNNLFDRASAAFGTEWGIDETLDRAISDGRIDPVIVVGIYNTNKRAQEYLPENQGAAEYLRFIESEIKPFIDRHLRTLPNRESTYLMGSSLGGVFTLQTAWHDNRTFSRFIAMSTSYWWGDFYMESILANPPALPGPSRVWIDMGDSEGSGQRAVDSLLRAYDAAVGGGGLRPEEQIRAQVFEHAGHNEQAWGTRFEQALRYIAAPIDVPEL